MGTNFLLPRFDGSCARASERKDMNERNHTKVHTMQSVSFEMSVCLINLWKSEWKIN